MFISCLNRSKLTTEEGIKDIVSCDQILIDLEMITQLFQKPQLLNCCQFLLRKEVMFEWRISIMVIINDKLHTGASHFSGFNENDPRLSFLFVATNHYNE